MVRKNVKAALVCSLCVVSLLFGACSSKKIENKEKQTVEETQVTEEPAEEKVDETVEEIADAVVTEETEEETLSEETIENIKNAVEKYAETIESIDDYVDYSTYGLIYIDEDDIPELYYACEDSHAYGVTLYNFDGEKVNELGTEGSNGSVIYMPKSNIVMHLWSGMGVDSFEFMKISDSKDGFEEFDLYEKPMLGMEDYGAEYSINDAVVSEEEFYKEYNELKKTIPNNGCGMTSVTIKDGFLIKEFDKDDFINNYDKYIVETPINQFSVFNEIGESMGNLFEQDSTKLANEFISQSGVNTDDVLFLHTLMDGDGAFIFVGKKNDDKYDGKLWFISSSTKAKVINESEKGYSIMNGIIGFDYYYVTEYGESDAVSYVYSIKDGDAYEVKTVTGPVNEEEFQGISE